MPVDDDMAMTSGLSVTAELALHAVSDVAVLEHVLVHRPGAELDRITAATADDYLFDGVVAAGQAQREHDELAAALGADGARVELLEAVLARALTRSRAWIDGLCDDPAALAWLHDLPAEQLARTLIGGLTDVELHGRGSGRWLVRPLPNLMFTRDLFTVIGDGVARGGMRREARVSEGALAHAVLTELEPARWWTAGDVEIEGGDVIPLEDGVVVVGIGERTTRVGALQLARRLLTAGAAREVIGAVMPPDGPFHLDLAFSMVDRGTFLVDHAVADATATIRWRPDRPPIGGGGLMDAVGKALETDVRAIHTLPESHGRAWDRGANVVALGPGRVVAYADNRATNRRLEREGIEVLAVPGKRLGLGRGGPRCLTAPLARRG